QTGEQASTDAAGGHSTEDERAKRGGGPKRIGEQIEPGDDVAAERPGQCVEVRGEEAVDARGVGYRRQRLVVGPQRRVEVDAPLVLHQLTFDAHHGVWE